MNMLEGKVRRAISETAADIAPGSIPPLSLAKPGPLSRPARRRRWWRPRLTAPLAAAAAVAAVIAAAVIAGTGHRGPAHQQPVLSPGQRAQLNEEIIGLLAPASSAQYRVGAQFLAVYGALTAADFNACMARSGFRMSDHPVPPGRIRPFDSRWPDLAFAARTGKQVLGPWEPGERILPPDPKPVSPARQRSYHAALGQCLKYHLMMPIDPDFSEVWVAWGVVVSRVTASAPAQAPQAGLRACAQQHGVPASSARSYSRLEQWMEAAGFNTTAGRHRVRVYARCSQAYVANLFRLELIQQQVFLREHHQQIRAYQQLAARQVAALEHKYGVPNV
jgi:hypothetical protein